MVIFEKNKKPMIHFELLRNQSIGFLSESERLNLLLSNLRRKKKH